MCIWRLYSRANLRCVRAGSQADMRGATSAIRKGVKSLRKSDRFATSRCGKCAIGKRQAAVCALSRRSLHGAQPPRSTSALYLRAQPPRTSYLRSKGVRRRAGCRFSVEPLPATIAAPSGRSATHPARQQRTLQDSTVPAGSPRQTVHPAGCTWETRRTDGQLGWTCRSKARAQRTVSASSLSVVSA